MYFPSEASSFSLIERLVAPKLPFSASRRTSISTLSGVGVVGVGVEVDGSGVGVVGSGAVVVGVGATVVGFEVVGSMEVVGLSVFPQPTKNPLKR